LRNGVTQSRLVVALHQQRRNSCSAQSRRARGGY
jgi:hypothetical protein